MRVLDTREQTAALMRRNLWTIGAVLAGLWLVLGATLPLEEGLRLPVFALAGLYIAGLFWLSLKMVPRRYQFAYGIVSPLWHLCGVSVLGLCLPAVWLQDAPLVSLGLWAVMLGLIALGVWLGLARLDRRAQEATLRRGVRPDGDRLRLTGKEIDITGHTRRFSAAGERAFQALVALFSAAVLVLAIFGGGSALVVLSLLEVFGITQNAEAIALIALAFPVLAASSYGASGLFVALQTWRALLEGQRELWPED